MRIITGILLIWFATGIASVSAQPVTTQVYFGDTHLHSNYSFDAFLNFNHSADPDTAYRWAKGLPVIHPYNRARVKINTPLDFVVVSDHAEMLGVMRAVREETAVFEDQGPFQNLKRWFSIKLMNRAIDNGTGLEFFSRFLPPALEIDPSHADPVKNPANNIDDVSVFGNTDAISKVAWADIIATADRHNVPGKFTALIGWEWSSIPTGANLHRVVITPDGADKAAQFLPFGSDDSQYPEDLWQWLEETQRSTGARFIAIPHNSNISKGYMFDSTTLRGTPIDAEYAQRRMQWEPVVEVTQIKGDSETNSQLSPEDEFADFENYNFYIQTGLAKYVASASDFVRPALKRGLVIGQQVGVNPYKFGLIGSSDSHSGLASVEEKNFWGKMARDSTPETKSSGQRLNGSDGWNMSASGLAAVWATENTREAIFAAFRRKEVYATTGPRLKVQMFGAWGFPKGTAKSENFARIGYQYGVPMGGDLTATKTKSAPSFILRAVKDPVGANLDRMQIVKGWVNERGQQFEKVYNVAWSGQRELDANGKLPSVGNTVDTQAATYTNNVGEAELFAQWVDPDFDPNQSAFYYARVLQIPTPRNALYDSLALGLEKPPSGPKTIQERAYTSPIWYQPD
jgi:hypothetical protein